MDNEEIQSLLKTISDHLMSMDQPWQVSVAEKGASSYTLEVPESVGELVLAEFVEDIQYVSYGDNDQVGIGDIQVDGRSITISNIHEEALTKLASDVEDMTIIYVPDESQRDVEEDDNGKFYGVIAEGGGTSLNDDMGFTFDMDAIYTSTQMYYQQDKTGLSSGTHIAQSDAVKLIVLPGIKVSQRETRKVSGSITHVEDMLGGPEVYEAFEKGLDIICVPYFDVDIDEDLFVSDGEFKLGPVGARYSEYSKTLVEEVFDSIIPNKSLFYGGLSGQMQLEEVAKEVGKVNFFAYSIGSIAGEAIQNAFARHVSGKGYSEEEVDMLAKRVGYVATGDLGYFGRPEDSNSVKFTSVHSFSVYDMMVDAYINGGFDREHEAGVDFAFARALDRVSPPPSRAIPSTEGKEVAIQRINSGREVLLLSTARDEEVALPRRISEGESEEAAISDAQGNKYTFVERVDRSAHNLGVTTRIGHSVNHSNLIVPVANANVLAGMLRASELGREKNLDELMVCPVGPLVDGDKEELPQRNMLKLAKTPSMMFTETMLQLYIGEGPEQSTGWSVT